MAVVAVFPVLVAHDAVVFVIPTGVVRVIAQGAQFDACRNGVGVDEVALAAAVIREFRGEGRGDADVGVVRQFGRIQHGAVCIFVAQGDFPAVVVRFVRRRGVQVLCIQPQGVFARVGDAHRAVVFAFFEVGESRFFAVDFDRGVSGKFGRQDGKTHQPGEFLGAVVAVVRERGSEFVALDVAQAADGFLGLLRVVADVLPQDFELFQADEVVRSEAGRAAIAVGLGVVLAAATSQAFARGLVFAEQGEGGCDVEAVAEAEFVASFTVVTQKVAAYGLFGVRQGVVGVAVFMRGFGAVAAVVAAA